METSKIFEKLEEVNLSDRDKEILELLEESITDITPEGTQGYMTVPEYFGLVKGLFIGYDTITSTDIESYVSGMIDGDKQKDLFQLDGLNSLAKCLRQYGGKDNLRQFEIWFEGIIMKVQRTARR